MKQIQAFTRGIWFYTIFFYECWRIRKKIRKLPREDEKTYTTALQQLYKNWMDDFLENMGITVEYHGLENLKGIERAVLVANHTSFLDIMITTPFLPLTFKTIAKASPGNIPLFGDIYAAGSVLVDRDSDASRKRAFREMYRLLENNISTLFYPEGTRNTTRHTLLPFEDGAFTLAVMQNAPVLPIAIKGAKEMLPPGCSFTPGTIHVFINTPLIPEHFVREKKEKIDDIKNTAWRSINHALS